MCKICFHERKIFISEIKVYKKDELQSHNEIGDVLSGTKGHPTCHLCNHRFYDIEVLYNHLNKTHCICCICQQNESNIHTTSLSSTSNSSTSSSRNTNRDINSNQIEITSNSTPPSLTNIGYYYKNSNELFEHHKE